LAALNDLDDAATVRYARTLLSLEIRRAELPHRAARTSLAHLQVFLQNYIEGNDQIRLGALDQLKEKQYDMTVNPQGFKHECIRLFQVARINDVQERLRYLHDMLPDRLYAVMVAANPQTIDAFFDTMQRYWRRQKKEVINVADEEEVQPTNETSTLKMLVKALQDKPRREEPRRETPQCKNCGRTGHWAAECYTQNRRPYQQQSGQIPGTCNWCGIRGHIERECRRKNRGPSNNFQGPPRQSENMEDLVKRVSQMAISNFVEQQRPNQNNHQGNRQDNRREPPRCYSCGRTGHMANQCNHRRHDTNALGEDPEEPPSMKDLFQESLQEQDLLGSIEEEEEQALGRRFRTLTAVGTSSNPTAIHTYLMIAGQKYKTLIDTGASISLISEEVLHSIDREVQEHDTLSAIAVDGTLTDIIGLVRNVDVQLDDLTIPATFRVMVKTSYPVLLGWDFLKQAKSVIIADRMILQATWKGQQVEIPFFDNTNSRPENQDLLVQPYYAEDAEFEEINAIKTIRFKDLGQYLFRREYDVFYQAITGSRCKYCKTRAEDHHPHYLLFENQEDASKKLPY